MAGPCIMHLQHNVSQVLSYTRRAGRRLGARELVYGLSDVTLARQQEHMRSAKLPGVAATGNDSCLLSFPSFPRWPSVTLGFSSSLPPRGYIISRPRKSPHAFLLFSRDGLHGRRDFRHARYGGTCDASCSFCPRNYGIGCGHERKLW